MDDKIFQRGSCNVTFEKVFADSVSWVARIRLPVSAWLHPVKDALRRAQNDIALSEIDYVKEHTNIPIPAIFYFDLNGNGNDVGAAYILMEAVPGSNRPSVFSSVQPAVPRETLSPSRAGPFAIVFSVVLQDSGYSVMLIVVLPSRSGTTTLAALFRLAILPRNIILEYTGRTWLMH